MAAYDLPEICRSRRIHDGFIYQVVRLDGQHGGKVGENGLYIIWMGF